MDAARHAIRDMHTLPDNMWIHRIPQQIRKSSRCIVWQNYDGSYTQSGGLPLLKVNIEIMPH